MSVVGSLLATLNILVVAFGIHLLRTRPDLVIVAWLLVITYLLSRRRDVPESTARLLR